MICPKCGKEHSENYDVDVPTEHGNDVQAGGCHECYVATISNRYPLSVCPKCGKQSDMNWPLEINGVIKDGGCQACWEAECSETWWAQFKTPADKVQEQRYDPTV